MNERILLIILVIAIALWFSPVIYVHILVYYDNIKADQLIHKIEYNTQKINNTANKLMEVNDILEKYISEQKTKL